MNIGTLLPRHARFRSDHPAFVFGEHRFTYRALNAYVNRLANALLNRGMVKGEKLATILPNSLELMASYWAAAKTGIVIVPCSTLLQESGLTNLLRDSDTVTVIADGQFADTLNRIKGALPGVREMVIVGKEPGDGFLSYEDLLAGGSEDEPPDAGLIDSDVFNIMYSSGTTGAPKGIIHTHYIRAMYCTLFASAWRMTPESVALHAGAIVFNGAMLDLMPWMYLGCTYILHETFNAEAVIRDIEKERVTHVVLVPAQISAILNSPEFRPEALSSLEMIHNVGAPLHLEYKKRLNDLLPGCFYELYGLTEGFVTVLDKHDAIRKVGSVGVPPAFFEMRILNEKGEVCAPGEIGEICGRGPIMMPGYYKRPDLTEKAIVDGWLHTGDAGYVDEDGYLFLVDRIKDMIISGGVNVYPKDIEEIIIQHPGVSEVAVFGVPDERWGETPVAAVVIREGESLRKEDIIGWTNSRVDAKFQRISDVVIMEAFPRNVAGKTLKREMREAYNKTR
ncbi:MAG: AMP-binding protein [Deltaproteobacteria bacterium]|nr:AMP-binding protein [Deltaproteobacteria bacterium]